MEIITKAENLKLTQSLKNFINKKIGDLSKFGKGIARVEVGRTSFHHKKGLVFRAICQIKNLRTEARSTDLRKAIIQVKDEMQVRLKKYKEKKNNWKNKL